MHSSVVFNIFTELHIYNCDAILEHFPYATPLKSCACSLLLPVPSPLPAPPLTTPLLPFSMDLPILDISHNGRLPSGDFCDLHQCFLGKKKIIYLPLLACAGVQVLTG